MSLGGFRYCADVRISFSEHTGVIYQPHKHTFAFFYVFVFQEILFLPLIENKHTETWFMSKCKCILLFLVPEVMLAFVPLILKVERENT